MRNFNDINFTIVRDYDALSRYAADRVIETLTKQPGANLLVPTGTTPTGTYNILSAENPRLFRGVSVYNFDDYAVATDDGSFDLLSAEDPRSYQAYMRRHLLGAQRGIKNYFPNRDNVEQPGTYDKLIAENGGLQLCLNAIGEDGHTFGFNFPGAAFDSVSRLVAVNDSTKKVNAGLTGDKIEDHALTSGVKTGMSAEKVLVLVSGVRKAEILARVFESEVDESLTATVLHTHPDCQWVIDEAAASRLGL